MTIVIAGGSGFIGTLLTRRLLELGHTTIVVAQSAPSFTHEKLFFINCDIAQQPLPYNILERTDVVINLAGTSMFQKWTPKIKKEIYDSRIKSTKRIVESIASAASRPPVFICASATGYYGDTGEEVADEQSTQGQGFLATLVGDWEAEARKASEYGVRVVLLRTAPVLGHGGILATIAKTSAWGFLMKIKKEDFWISWVHQDDIVNAYVFALETGTLQGVVNVASPEPIKQNHFMKLLGKYYHTRILGTLPHRLANFFLGEWYEEITKNSRVVPKRLADKGFTFQYPGLEQALASLAVKKK